MIKSFPGVLLATTVLSFTLGCSEKPEQSAAVPVPPKAAAPAVVPDTDWSLHGNDVGEQRYSRLAQINRDNIDAPYVDGVSLTYGDPRNHIWTFVSAIDESTS